MRAERGTAKTRLLQSTARLIEQRGVNAVGVDAIAEQAGITKRTLYLHFKGKDWLVSQALSARSQQWHDWFAGELDRRGRSPQQQLLAMFDLLGQSAAADGYRGCIFVNAAADLPDRDHPARAVASEHKQRLLDFITGLCRRLGARRPDLLARQLKLLLEGLVATALVDPGGQPAQDARAVAETLIAQEKSRHDG
ncbi:MAG TPA: TetR family transcriptional regulator [Candidatus Limnocylindrales bacterium]